VANKIAPRMERRGGGGINRLAAIVEPAMTAGSNILAEIPAYAAGMAELNKTGLPSEGVRRAEEVSERLTYNPRTMEGQAGLQSLTNGVMKVMDALGVDEAINYLNNTIVPNLQRTFGEEGAREIGSSVMMALPFVRKVPSMKAFHGSPHDFDKFSTAQIGTGEGAQAYGHGLYFAESEDVARGYRDKLTDKFNPADPDSTAVTYVNDYDTSDAEAFLEQIDIDVIGTDIDPANHRTFYEMGDGSRIMHNLETDSFEAVGDTSGSMYQVEIDASPDELLDWDLPLSEQSEKVRRAIDDMGLSGAAGIKENPNFPDDFGMIPTDDPKGSELLSRSAQKNWAKMDKPGYGEAPFKQAGIKGIKYKDGFSRGADGGTSNYVIFDDRLISIAKKYGIAIPAAAALLSQETGLNPSSLYEEDNPV
jgi:hypothetical protein